MGGRGPNKLVLNGNCWVVLFTDIRMLCDCQYLQQICTFMVYVMWQRYRYFAKV